MIGWVEKGSMGDVTEKPNLEVHQGIAFEPHKVIYQVQYGRY
jgi:hypothetical protein